MKKLSKIKLQNAVVLQNSEMKQVLGGSGSSGGDSSMCGGSGNTHICECSNIPGKWCGTYYGGTQTGAVNTYCGGYGSCRPFQS